MENTLYTNPMLRPHISAFFKFIEEQIAPRLNYNKVMEYVSVDATFRSLDIVEFVRNDDVICDKTFDDELVVALLVDGSILVNGGWPLSNFSEACDSMPHITAEGGLGSPTTGENQGEFAYIYRTDYDTLQRQEVIDSMNAFLAYPAVTHPSFPFVTTDYNELVES